MINKDAEQPQGVLCASALGNQPFKELDKIAWIY